MNSGSKLPSDTVTNVCGTPDALLNGPAEPGAHEEQDLNILPASL
jgi:hypothetical protein